MSIFVLIKDPATQKIGCVFQSNKKSVLEFSSINEAQVSWQSIQFGNLNSVKKELYEKMFLCLYEPRLVESDILYITDNIYDIQTSECSLFGIRNFVLWDKVGQTLWDKAVPLSGKW